MRPLAEQQMGPLRGGSWGPRENRSFRGEKDERRNERSRRSADRGNGAHCVVRAEAAQFDATGAELSGVYADEDELPARLMRQFENFFNYDGTGRGQKDLDD